MRAFQLAPSPQSFRRAIDRIKQYGWYIKVFIGPDLAPILPSDTTQQLDANELAQLLAERSQANGDDSAPELDVQVKVNVLPDFYGPNDKPPRD